MSRDPLQPASLFDAAVRPGGESWLAARDLEVVTRPGMTVPRTVPPGLFAVRRAFGEGRLAVVLAVERIVRSRAALDALGIPGEGRGDGVFIVADGLSMPRGLRIAGPDGLLSREVVLLRERPRPRATSAAPTPEPAAEDTASDTAFILDGARSTLERLPAEQRSRYLGFAWHANDFPGGPEGPNESRATQMFAALSRLRPERRANAGQAAAVRADEFDAAMQRRIAEAIVDVPDERGQRLHRAAAAAYAEMRAAAAADGVTIRIHNSYRTPAQAQANAARADNRLAVAPFSSHSLGLAVDLRMAHGSRRFQEITTRPFQNLVDMYTSPVHKWMFLRAERFGWYPYQHEPWHWEYNPPGLRERLRQADSAALPGAGAVGAAIAAAAAAATAGAAAGAASAGAPAAGAAAAAAGVAPREDEDAEDTASDTAFIVDGARSTLERLPADERSRYLGFAWHANDFPGGPEGPNEARARQMFTALSRLRPERRANSGPAAAVRADEFDAAMQRRIADAIVDVPDERGQRLHRAAAAAYVDMRTAAAADGVTIRIHNSYRTPAQAQANAAGAGNRLAVASFSSHSLGLAVDLRMSHGSRRFQEVTTRPFQNLVDMYTSPVHKWMFLRAERFGWYPYQFEPWHWEYNPPGFRERLRQSDSAVSAIGAAIAAGAAAVGSAAASAVSAAAAAVGATSAGAASAAPREDEAEGIDDPIPPSPAVPAPTADTFSAIGRELGGITQTIARGLTITGAVGATASGNAPADVRAVQRRLVEIGRLPASHAETPAADAGGAVPQARLSRTITAIRRVQDDAGFFLSRRMISGAMFPGVVTPGDATASLLDRIAVYNIGIGTAQVSLRDHVASGAAQSETGVAFVGTASPAALPLEAFVNAGLTAPQAAALKLVSTFEGNFDAINTYDRAIVSAGFIQFAGGRGLPPYLALLKARQPAKFRDLLQRFGIDVEFNVSAGAISGARLVIIDPAGSRVLRATEAETAIREDKRLTAALILSGRDRAVQGVQIEAAARGYVRPALAAAVAPSARGGRVRLGEILRSQKGLATLFDRAIHEGIAAARRRFERVIQRVVRAAEPRTAPGAPPPPTVQELQRREGDILAELERDLQAAADVAANIGRARVALQATLRAAATAGATVASVLARPELATARQAVTAARSGLPDVVNVTGSDDVDATLTATTAALTDEERRLALTPPPSSTAELSAALSASSRALEQTARPFSTAPRFLDRIRRIRRSTLDAGLTEAA